MDATALGSRRPRSRPSQRLRGGQSVVHVSDRDAALLAKASHRAFVIEAAARIDESKCFYGTSLSFCTAQPKRSSPVDGTGLIIDNPWRQYQFRLREII